MSDDVVNASIRDQVAAFLGAERYNQCIAEAFLVRKRNRLRYAQEEIFKRLEVDTGVSIKTPQDYLAVFEAAPEIPLGTGPLTRAAFLADPIRLWYSDRRNDIERGWFKEAWRTRPFFRERLTFELTESVQLHGNFRKAAKLLKYLPTVLERDDVIALFKTIRYESPTLYGRVESEWRPKFERAFSEHAEALPPPTP